MISNNYIVISRQKSTFLRSSLYVILYIYKNMVSITNYVNAQKDNTQLTLM